MYPFFPPPLHCCQLTERRRGNTHYRAGRYTDALRHYERAKAVVDFVQALSRADQAEVDVNRVAVELNIAAVHLATKTFGAAVRACDRALALDSGNPKALARRARANAGRHEYEAATADVVVLRDADLILAAEVGAEVERARAACGRRERRQFAAMFDRGTAAAST
jgi:tetratricopeptide (TPR) repeat protein